MDLTKVNRILKALRNYADNPEDRPTMSEIPDDQFVILSRGDKDTVAAALFALHLSPDREAFPVLGFPLATGEAVGEAQALELADHLARTARSVLRSTIHTAILAFKDRVLFGVVNEQFEGSVSFVYAVLYRDGEALQVAYAGPSYEEAKAQYTTFTVGKN